MIHYVCKYTPIELFKGFGEECIVLEEMPENFDVSDRVAHANLCGFGKSVIQAVLEGKVENYTLDSLKMLRLKNGVGCKTRHQIHIIGLIGIQGTENTRRLCSLQGIEVGYLF